MNIRAVLSLLLFIAFHIHSGYSQTYHFTSGNEPYLPLQNGINLVKTSWDDPVLSIPIGFNFQLFGETVQNIYLPMDFSYITFSDALSLGSHGPLIALYGADLVNRGYLTDELQSPITYKTTGAAGNKILTVEFSNAGYFGDLNSNGTSTDYVNLQIKIYEADGSIVFHYGPSLTTFPELDFDSLGPIVGLLEDVNFFTGESNSEVLLLSGNPSNPTVITEFQEVTLTGGIPEGTKYTFERISTPTHDISAGFSKTAFYPNPFNDVIRLKPNSEVSINGSVSIIDINGKTILTTKDPLEINTSNLADGMYTILFQTKDGSFAQRMIRMN